MYRLVNNSNGVLTWIDTADGLCIPIDPANTDYQEYLRWCEAGTVPLPADEVQS